MIKEKNLQEIKEIMQKSIVNGHFVFTSGLHSRSYINKKLFMTDDFLPFLAQVLIQKINNLEDDLLGQIDIIAGPHTGGFILAEYVAEQLSIYFKEKLGIEKELLVIGGRKNEDGNFELDDPLLHLSRKRVLLIDDVLTTGSTLRPFKEELWKRKAWILAAGVLWDRSDQKNKLLGLTTSVAIVNQHISSWEGDDCPLCKKGILLDQKPK